MKESGRMLIILAKTSVFIAQPSRISGFRCAEPGAVLSVPSERQQRQSNRQR